MDHFSSQTPQAMFDTAVAIKIESMMSLVETYEFVSLVS